LQGFAKGWGWQQFARAIEDELTPQRRSLREKEYAARYQWLREWPGRPRDYMGGGVPWVVQVVKDAGVPTMQPMYEGNLDAAIDKALREHEKRAGVVEVAQ
jgi:hypothetical protein